jgi:outer membrane protein OmpA-like peptidoglycan-associated protein
LPGRPFTPPGAPGADDRNAAPGAERPDGRGPGGSPDRTDPRGNRDDGLRDRGPRDQEPRDQGLRERSPRDESSRGDDRREDRERREAFERAGPRTGFNAPGRPGYVPGGFRDDDETRDFDRVRRDRREFQEDGRTYIREPGRIIVRDRDNYFIRHDENERFRDLGRGGYRSERRGGDTITYLDRPGGEQIVTIVDDDGRLVRRSRRFRDGREVVIIDNAFGGGARRPIYDDVVDLPPPDIRIPRNRYVVDYDGADEGAVYEALSAPPVVAVDRRYTLDQVRYSPQLRARMRSIDIDTITFDTGSFTVTPDQAARLSTMAAAINRAIKANPQEVFLIEGYTDAVGSDVDNLSLSDRRAQSVATVLSQNFSVPPENLTTQGYGEQSLKVNTQNASRENRRVTVRRITPLIQQQGEAAPPPR